MSGVNQSPSPLTLLKSGTESPSIFIAHGIGGRISDLIPLASHISTLNPIYGVSAPGADGSAGSFDSIDGLAHYYLDAIKKQQPEGPYFLIGYSLGGLAFFEMSRRLLQGGKNVRLLAMLESYPHTRALPLSHQIDVALAGLKRRFRGQAGEEIPARDVAQDDAADRWPPELLAKANGAWKRYRPRAYRGRVRFVQAAINSGFSANPRAFWSRLAAELDSITVAGNHTSIVSEHYRELAAVLSGYITEAIQSK
jgi:thioesterase domain-containing protein